MEKVVSEAEELPKAIVRRVVKDKLSDCSPDYDINIHKDALLAFAESARIFIHYLSATANDVCKESRRQTINSEDVFKALEETEFSEFVKPLKASLAEFKKKKKKKNDGKKDGGAAKEKEVKKKRKIEESSGKSGSKSKQKKGDNDNDNEENEEDDNGNE